MTPRTRRAVLGLAGAAAAGLAGCSNPATPDDGTDDGDGPDTTASAGDTTTGASLSGTPAGLRLEPTAVPDSGRVVVYPTDLQGWLREAASTDETVRQHAAAPVVRPDPPLHAFETVRLVDEAGDIDGWYRVRGESGIRYEYSATATEATPPEGTTVTPVSELQSERRSLAEAAIEAPFSDRSYFYPETALGEWARHDFFGGYYRHEGTVYQGMERQQTDAAFFSRECFYIIELEPVDDDAASGPDLRLGTLDEQTRDTVDSLLSDREPRRTAAGGSPAPSRAGARTLAEAGHLLSHTAVFSVAVTYEG